MIRYLLSLDPRLASTKDAVSVSVHYVCYYVPVYTSETIHQESTDSPLHV